MTPPCREVVLGKTVTVSRVKLRMNDQNAFFPGMPTFVRTLSLTKNISDSHVLAVHVINGLQSQ